MEEQINGKIKDLCVALDGLKAILAEAYEESDKTAFYKAVPRGIKAAQVVTSFLHSWNSIAESQKRIDALRQELES